MNKIYSNLWDRVLWLILKSLDFKLKFKGVKYYRLKNYVLNNHDNLSIEKLIEYSEYLDKADIE